MLLNKFIHLSIFTASFLMLSIITGCDTAETTNGTVTISFSPSVIIQKISDDTIQLDTVKILLRDIKLKNQSGNDEMNIKTGSFVVYLNLDAMTTDFAIGNVPPGSYDRVRFSIHKLEDSETPPDPEFREDSLRYSVIVKGTYNSVPFIYKSKKSAHQDLKLETPILVEENTEANLTITVDPPDWFYKNDSILDPNDPANENDIDNNIKDSFKKSFRDDDRDGK